MLIGVLTKMLSALQATFSFEDDLDPDVEVVNITAKMQPFHLESMKKAKDAWIYSTGSDLTMTGLRNWKTVVVPSQLYSVHNFRSFMPDRNVDVGQVYSVIGKNTFFYELLTSTRYFPPSPEGKEVLLYRLLAQLHPRPFVHMRFPPQGSIATVRAENEEYLDIVFRCHVEFQMNEPPLFPYWFTPAQLSGRLIIKRDASHLRHFSLYLPTNKSLNVGMLWFYSQLVN